MYNEESKTEYETIRDFIILHYYVNERNDSDFWRDMRNLPLPDRLAHKIQVFSDVGEIFNDQHDIFRDASWLQVMLGQGILPKDYHPSVNQMSDAQLSDMLAKVHAAKRQPLAKMLPHDEFLTHYLKVG